MHDLLWLKNMNSIFNSVKDIELITIGTSATPPIIGEIVPMTHI